MVLVNKNRLMKKRLFIISLLILCWCLLYLLENHLNNSEITQIEYERVLILIAQDNKIKDYISKNCKDGVVLTKHLNDIEKIYTFDNYEKTRNRLMKLIE